MQRTPSRGIPHRARCSPYPEPARYGMLKSSPSCRTTSARAPEVERLCSRGQMLLLRETALRHISAVVIVGPHPLRGEALNLFNAGPAMLR